MPLADRQIKNAKPTVKAYKLTDDGELYLHRITPRPPMLERVERAGWRGKNARRGNPPPLFTVVHLA